LLRLLLAHMVTDFILQPGKWVEDKKNKKLKSWCLYWHGLVTGAVAWLFLWDLSNYQIPLFIAITHTAIDAGKLYLKDDLATFLADQLLHLGVLVAAWLYLTEESGQVLPVISQALASEKFMVLLTGFAFVIWPVSYLISKATVRWRQEVEEAIQAAATGNPAATAPAPASLGSAPAAASKDSLESAGMYIGMLERVLVLIFVLTDHYDAIGLLIAAKSILRFSDKLEQKPRKQTEYVLIGTLISFTITIILGLLIKAYLKL
jgi:hypothetical protein